MATGKQPSGLVEIVRSFSFRLNAGNYESRDFFCSRKIECFEADADEASRAAHDWCKRQVMAAVREHQDEQKQARGGRGDGH